MDREYLAYFGANFRLVGLGKLVDWKLRIDVPCEYVGVGYASIRFEKSAQTYGAFYYLDRLSFTLLSILEWVPFGFYRVEEVLVYVEGLPIRSKTFVGVLNRAELGAPAEYLNDLAESASAIGAPREYVEYVQALQRCEPTTIDHNFNLIAPSKRRLFYPRFTKVIELHDRLRELISKALS